MITLTNEETKSLLYFIEENIFAFIREDEGFHNVEVLAHVLSVWSKCKDENDTEQEQERQEADENDDH